MPAFDLPLMVFVAMKGMRSLSCLWLVANAPLHEYDESSFGAVKTKD
jgi:hypothetical protein